MAINEEIARLTGTLKWNVDNRPLLAFQNRLAKVHQSLSEFSALANKKFGIKVQLDARTLREQLERAANVKISFKNFHIDGTALDLVQTRIKDTLDRTRINLKNVHINMSETMAQRAALRKQLENVTIGVKVGFKFTEANASLQAWKKVVEDKFKLRLSADLHQGKLYGNLNASLRAATNKLGTFNIKQPKIQLGIDRQHLRAEISSVLEQIKREVRIKIDLNSMVSGSGRGRSSRASHNAAGAGLAGGIVGEGFGLAKGFLPGLGAAYAVSQLNTINQQMKGQQNAMTAVMGSQSAGQEQSAWVKNLSNTIGMDYRQVQPSYTKMLASGQTSGMSTKSVQNIFQGISEYSRVMGLDTEATKGSMVAIEQMMNKGQVMSEELKGQLAERMPGAMSAMAEAAGFGTDDKAVGKLMDAMKNGDVKSAAVLEKFADILAKRARAGGALEKAMKSTAAEQARMNNAFSDSVTTLSEGGFDEGMASFFRGMSQAMEKAQPLVKALGGAFQMLIEPVNAVVRIIGAVGAAWDDFAAKVGVPGSILLLLPALLFPVTTAFALLALAIDDVITYAQGGDSAFGEWIASTPEAKKAVDDLTASWKALGDTIANVFSDGNNKNLSEFSKILESLSFSSQMITLMERLEGVLTYLRQVIQSLQGAKIFGITLGGESQAKKYSPVNADVQGGDPDVPMTDEMLDNIRARRLAPPRLLTATDIQQQTDFRSRNAAYTAQMFGTGITPLSMNQKANPQSQITPDGMSGIIQHTGDINITFEGSRNDSDEALAQKLKRALQESYNEIIFPQDTE